LKALLVEDEAVIGAFWQEAMARMGIETEVAFTCRSAQQLLLRMSFDICFLDLLVRDGNTISLADFIKSRYPQTPIVVVTATSVGPRGELATDCNFDMILRKPVGLRDLTAVTEHLLRTPIAS